MRSAWRGTHELVVGVLGEGVRVLGATYDGWSSLTFASGVWSGLIHVLVSAMVWLGLFCCWGHAADTQY